MIVVLCAEFSSLPVFYHCDKHCLRDLTSVSVCAHTHTHTHPQKHRADPLMTLRSSPKKPIGLPPRRPAAQLGDWAPGQVTGQAAESAPRGRGWRRRRSSAASAWDREGPGGVFWTFGSGTGFFLAILARHELSRMQLCSCTEA